MPPLPFAQNCLRVRVMHTIGSDTNTGWHLFFRGDKPGTQPNLLQVANAASSNWGNFLNSLTAVDVTATHFDVLDLSSDTAAFATNTTPSTGTRAGGFLNASTSVLANFAIPRRYRGGKPRVYLPMGVQPDLATPQTWTGTFTTAVHTGLQNYIAALKTAMSSWSSITDQVNISYYHLVNVAPAGSNPIYRTVLRDTPQIDIISGSSISAIVSTQRRRLRPGS